MEGIVIIKNIEKKDSYNRFIDYTTLLKEALNSSYELFNCNSIEEDTEELFYLVRHSEFLWNDSIILLENEAYSSAVFFAIVTIEELGKCAIGRFLINNNESQRQNKNYKFNKKDKKSSLLNHRKKHQIAAFSGLAINARADRILGTDNILKLFNLIKGGHLENIRQSSIYSESKEGILILPKMKLKKDDAIFFCTVAGELLCELGGIVPSEFERLIDRIDEFEKQYLLKNYNLNIT